MKYEEMDYADEIADLARDYPSYVLSHYVNSRGFSIMVNRWNIKLFKTRGLFWELSKVTGLMELHALN